MSYLLQSVDGIVFDFNGTLFEDGRENRESWDRISLEIRGKALSDEEFSRYNGRTDRDMVRFFLPGCSDSEVREISRMVGLGALKYFILKVDPRKNMTFNPKESIDFNGNTGPFIQYTNARINSIMRRADNEGFTIAPAAESVEMSDKERTLIQSLAKFPDIVRQAGEEYSPALIANYVYDLVKEYNQYYQATPILKEENRDVKNLRLLISRNVGRIITSGMNLLGIEMPERM